MKCRRWNVSRRGHTAGLAILLVVLVGSRGRAQEQARLAPTLVAVVNYEKADAPRLLSLWRHAFPKPPKTALIAPAGAWKGPGGRGFPTEVLYVVDAPLGQPGQGKVKWVWYVFYLRTVNPHPPLAATLVWHPQRQEAYVVLTRSARQQARFSAFRVDLARELAAVPPPFPVEGRGKWIRGAEPIAVTKKKLPGKHVCSIAIVRAMPEVSTLLVYGQLGHLKCSHPYLRLDLNTNAWSDVRVQPVPPGGG